MNLSNTSFRLFRCTEFPEQLRGLSSLSVSFKSQLSKYLLHKYQTTTSDLIHRFTSAKDILQIIKYKALDIENDNYSILILRVRAAPLLGPQYIIFAQDKNTDKISDLSTKCLVLVKSSITNFLLQALESLPFSHPLIFKPIQVPNGTMASIINELHFGFDRIILIYALPPPLDQKGTLKRMTVSVDGKDLREIAQDQLVLESVHDFMFEKTKINFRNLIMSNFGSTGFSISKDGKVRLGNDEDLQKLVVCLYDTLVCNSPKS